MSDKAPSPWRSTKEESSDSERDLYTIQIDRESGSATDVKLSIYRKIDGIVVDDFYNTGMWEKNPQEALTLTELRQLASELLSFLEKTGKKYVYANVNSTLRKLLEEKFGGEWIVSEDPDLIRALEVDQFIRLTPSTLKAIAGSK